MSSSKILITGSNGLIGSAAVEYFDRLGWEVYGFDNNMRGIFFGEDGDTKWNLNRLKETCKQFRHFDVDIRNREMVLNLCRELNYDLIVHAAAQPSHDLAAKRPFEDFDINATGTMNLLEGTRQFRPNAVFCFLSTNKVYGDTPNELPMREFATRWDYANKEHYEGINENCRIDQSKHSLFGASKLAADVMVQEYGRYFGLKTVCFRGGCLTGVMHSSAELHGFLAFLVKAVAQGRQYRIFGYKGKQVRDNLHAYDVCQAIHQFYLSPRNGEVYNLGGGRQNSISLLEAIDRVEQLLHMKLKTIYIEEPRSGDHICYISDLHKMKSHFPNWSVTRTLEDIFEEMTLAWIVGKQKKSSVVLPGPRNSS